MDVKESKKACMAVIGENIRGARTALGMSQEKLANLCGHSEGNARSWISKIEKGVNDVSASDLVLIARALGTSCSRLIGEGKDGDVSDLAIRLDWKGRKVYHDGIPDAEEPE